MAYDNRIRRSSFFVFSLISIIISPCVHASTTTNFCGTTWEDASRDCAKKQPCPNGTDEECKVGTCWGDTACDSTTGGGLVFDSDNPKHSRFCGIGWAEAKDNCSPATHCPSGRPDECGVGEQCYSFLPGCSYVDMMLGGGQEQTISKPKLPKLDPFDPARSNFCGFNFGDADGSCSDWCPSGSDGDCPGGKSCFAKTSCEYILDLEPSRTPIASPSVSPTQAPIIYNSIENTRFCGTGWDDASNTCRIDSHCESGLNSDCPPGQSCYGWISGCNIVDLVEHLLATGEEVFGKDRLPLPEVDGLELERVTGSPATTSPPSPPPVTIDPGSIIPENHLFCGYNYADASSKCSIETFCIDGVNHKCPPGEFCWSGVTACNAGEWWRAPQTTASPIKQPSVSPIFLPTLTPSRQPVIMSTEPAAAVTTQPTSYTVISTSDTTEIVLMTQSPVTTAPVSSPLVTLPSITAPPETSSAPVESSSSSPSHSPTRIQATIPISSSPTLTSTKYTLSEDEIANRLTSYNNYCAKSQAEVLSSCSYTLQTCNDFVMCPVGTNCFYNIMCPGQTTTVSPTSEPSSRPLTNSPTQSLQNYCAKSSLELLSKCNTAPTCNDGDEPCPENLLCFKDIMCDAIQGDEPMQEQETTKPTSHPVTSNPTIAPLVPVINIQLPEDPFECSGLCLMPIDSPDCGYIQNLGLKIGGCSRLEVQHGEFCTATGRCGTDLDLNNCHDQDLYLRVESSMCDDAGLVGGEGVIHPATSEAQASPTFTPSSSPIQVNDATKPSLPPVPMPSLLSINDAQLTDFEPKIDTATDKSNDLPNTEKESDAESDVVDKDIDNDNQKSKEAPDNFAGWWTEPASSCLTRRATLLSITGNIILLMISLY